MAGEARAVLPAAAVVSQKNKEEANATAAGIWSPILGWCVLEALGRYQNPNAAGRVRRRVV